MEGGNVFGGSNDMISLLENPNKLWLPSSSSFQGMMMNFDQEPQQIALTTLKRNRNDGSIMQTGDGEDTGEEETDLNRSEKKRRLTSQQVKFLEKSFEEENKLEPERKVELATQLGLEPRQVAIWFQNRRARYKTKQIEKEYDVLKDSYERLKVDYDSLNKLNEKLQNEVQVLKERLGENDKNETNSNLDTILQFEQVPSGIAQLHGMVDNTNSIVNVLIPCTKQVEDASSAKSDVIDSESPPCTDANQSSVHAVEASSTFMREFDQTLSEFSQEDEEHLLMNNNLLLPQTPPTINNFLKLTGDIEYDPNASSSNNSNALLVDDDQSSFWSWFYS